MQTEMERLGPLLIGLEGTRLSPGEVESLQHPAVGGVVLFTRNYADPQQLSELTAAIRAAARREVLITVDHEGGRVQRFREGFARLPPLGLLGRMHADQPDQALDMAYRHGRVMATELLLRGVDLSFAPVLDLDRGSRVIGDRAFSADPDTVTARAAFYLAGMHDAGMKTCGKHFPGHGSVEADSHTDDVLDARPLEQMADSDLVPFRALAGQLDSVMMAHVCYTSIDPDPAGYSRYWIEQILRGDLGFAGTVFSDDLVMQAALVAGKLADRLAATLEAGCDAALVCDPVSARELLDGLDGSPADATQALVRMKGHCAHTLEEVESVGEWRYWRKSIQELEQTKWA
jgi:beta-N-acetylhexosaminidase